MNTHVGKIVLFSVSGKNINRSLLTCTNSLAFSVRLHEAVGLIIIPEENPRFNPFFPPS